MNQAIENWNTTKVRNFCRPVDERAGSRRLEMLSVSAYRGVVPRSSISSNEPRADDLSIYKVCQPGDVVLNRMSAYQGAVGVSSQKGLVSPDYMVLRPTGNAVSRFLHHLFRSAWFTAEMASLVRGIGSTSQANVRTPRINWDELGGIQVRLPDGVEQRRIADFLDAETSQIATADGTLAELLHLLAERRKTLMGEVFDCNSASLGPFEFDYLPLRRAVSKWIDYRGATPVKSTSGIPLVTAGHIKDGTIDTKSSPEFLTPDIFAEWMVRGLPEVGDVLLTTEAPLGQVALVEDANIALAQRVVLLRPNFRLAPAEWIFWYLRSPRGQFELIQRATGSTALGIKVDRLRGLPIPIPNKTEMQRRLSWLVESLDGLQDLERLIGQQRALLAERRQALITTAVTGQLDVTTARPGVGA